MSAAAAERLELARGRRRLPTELHLPPGEPPWPLVVFVHGWWGHPRKFTRLFGSWTAAGLAVAAPAFPRTNDRAAKPDFDDVAKQPADVAYVLDRLLEDARFDPERVAAGGFSLGGITTLGVAFAERPHPRVAAAVAISGRLPWFAPPVQRPLPLLVVHGRLDRSVPYADGVEAYRFAPVPKALLTIELPGHQEYVEDDPPSAGDALVDAVTGGFLVAALDRAAWTPPVLDPALARLERDGV